MFHTENLIRKYKLSPTRLSKFIQTAASKYRDVAFHSFRHAFTVTHVSWRLMATSPRLRELTRSIDRLALLLAALCHDLDHPGVTNAFQARALFSRCSTATTSAAAEDVPRR